LKNLLLSLFLACSCAAYAGQGCEPRGSQADSIVKAITFAAKVIEKLDEVYPGNHQVVLIGRIGQDISKYGQKYSHGGYAYKEDGYWVIRHELNTCGTDQSSVYQEGIGNFFLDDLFKYEAMLVSFKEPYNTRLLNTLKDNSLAVRMHGGKYNMLYYPFSAKYQNSNGWLLETFVFASADVLGAEIENRESAQQLLKGLSYKPATLHIGMFTRLGARITKVNIAFDDQPFDERMAGNIQTVTFDDVVSFYEEKEFMDKKLEMGGDGE
jgi:hypothetical protein